MLPNVLDMYHGDNREELPDFAALKAAGIWGVIHKSSQGMNYRDPVFAARRAAAQAEDMPFGAYHFLDASDTEKQAANFLAATQWNIGLRIRIMAADYEKTSSTPALHQLLDFMTAIDNATGESTVLYSSDLIRETLQPLPGGHMAANMIGHEDFFRKHPLWLAEYGPHENVPWPWNSANVPTDKAPGIWLWQFSGTGRMPAIIGQVDLNFYAGTRDQLRAEWLPAVVATS